MFWNMNKIIAMGILFAGVLILSGCTKQQANKDEQQIQQVTISPISDK